MIAFVLGLTLLSVCSCGDLIETSGNGKLDGNWHLTAIDTLSTGQSTDVSADRKFLAVQGTMLVLNDADEAPQYMFRFSFSGGQLTLSDARFNDRTLGDPEVTDVAPLQPYGVNSLMESFAVEFPTSGRMVLTSSLLRLTFQKF